MIDIVLLDAGPLGLAAHPRQSAEMAAWLGRVLGTGARIMVPEIADFEVRRELRRLGNRKSLDRLDQFGRTFGYVPITTDAMRMAAEFWAETRKKGHPTAADKSLDADVILAGQAVTLAPKVVIVATSNPKHIGRFVNADDWRTIG